ncbi:MAG: DUF3048 N-terminal domain-containing protein, partial [Actinomycetes bacterium]
MRRPLILTMAASMALLASACTASTPSTPAASGSSHPSVTASPTPSIALDPLTGLPEPDPAAASRPALSIKVDNISPAMPQAGLNQADIVFEELVEGGLTRLFAVYHSAQATRVGPVRSARPTDAYLLRLLGGGIFAYSGASALGIAPVKALSHATRISWDASPSYFTVDTRRVPPHDVFASTATLWARGATLNPTASPPPPVFTYSSAVPAGRDATGVHLTFSGAS